MIQYCRYCSYALDYNGAGTDFLCFAPAPCGDDGYGMFYDAKKAKRPNKCRYFDFNENDVFGQDEHGNFRTYNPRKKSTVPNLEQIRFKEE